jgi:hypothetical protein
LGNRFLKGEIKMKEKFIRWIKAAGIRAIKTVAQTAVALIPVGVSIAEVGWGAVIGTAVLAGIVSLLTSIAGLPELKEKETE